jgi:hypothetical protein
VDAGQGNLTEKGLQVGLQSTANTDIKAGGNLSLNSTGNTGIRATGNLDASTVANASVKGLMTSVEGNTQVTVIRKRYGLIASQRHHPS